jgi:hypothetical protein
MSHAQTKCLVVTIGLIISAGAPTALAVPTDGLIAWWSFQGNANDASGNAHDGVVYGATLTEDRFGNHDSAYYFDGTNDYINIGTGVKPYMPLSVAGWVRLDSPAIGGAIFRNDTVNSAWYRYGVGLFVRDGYMYTSMFNGYSYEGSRRGRISYESDADAGTWHHAAVVFVSTNDIRLYWDGEPVDGPYHGTGSGIAYSSASGALGHWDLASPTPYLHGALDDVLVYGRALTDEEIHDLYGHAIIPAPSAVLLAALGIGIINRLRRQRAL